MKKARYLNYAGLALFLALSVFIICGHQRAFCAVGELGAKEKEAEAAYVKACMLFDSGLYEEAKRELAKTLEINPLHRGALDKAADIAKRRIAVGEKALKEKKAEPAENGARNRYLRKNYMLALEFIKQKDYVRARKHLSRIIEMDSSYQDAQSLFADLTLAIKEENQRAVINKKKIEAAQRFESLSENYALAIEFFQRKNYPESGNYLAKVMQIDPNYRNAQSLFADIALAQGKEKEEERMSNYTLGPGDVVFVYVKDNEEMSKEVKVQPGGDFVLPVVNEVIMVNDIPKEELQEIITQKLKKYLKEPQVQLVVKEYNSKKWYVLGEVKAKGTYKIGKPKLSLLEALYMANLPSEGVAAMRRAHVIHPDKDGPIRRNVNVYALLYKGDLSQNITIRPGDIIYVPKLAITKLTETLTVIKGPLGPVRQAMEDLETINTITPITREGQGPGQRP